MTLSRRCLLAMMVSLPVAPRMAVAASASMQPLAINLAPIRDWSTQQPFIDVFKTARHWIGHLPGQWGGRDFGALEAAGALDVHGWPMTVPRDLRSIGTLILTDLPEAAQPLAGRYRLCFDGDGIVEVGGRAQNIRYGRNEISFDFTPGPGSVDIRIQRSDPLGTGDYIRNISVMRDDLAVQYQAGARFRPGWLAMLRGMQSLRFMDWMNTNNSSLRRWDSRARPDDFSYTRRGAPLEVMLELANELSADAWLCVPHLMDDAAVRAMAEATLAGLSGGRRVHVEFSNEVWNFQFAQAKWAAAQARERWRVADRGAQFHGVRAADVARIWSEVFGAQAKARLVNVIATQTGWLGLERDILTAPLAEATGGTPPYKAFDAYAVTGYFGQILGTDQRRGLIADWLADSATAARAAGNAQGLSGAALEAYSAAHRYDHAAERAAVELRAGAESGDIADTLKDLTGRLWPYHAEVAKRYGLDLTMYEGGSHVVGLRAQVDDTELTDFFTFLNYSKEMGSLYCDLLGGWAALGAGPFNLFNDVAAPSKWGSWGAQRWPGDHNPRWRAIEARK